MTRIPVTVFTGFLGSGKTTLLNRLLRDPAAANTAVIVNEFGEIGLDHELIEKSDDSVVLLTNGCLCCTVRSDLVGTLRDLYFRRGKGDMPRFDRVVIETTGLADPSAVLDILLGDPVVQSRYALDGVVTVVDMVNAAASLDGHTETAKQVALADRIVLTKLDLLGADDSHLPELRARLRALNPSAQVLDGAAAAADLLVDSIEAGPADGERIRRWLGDEAFCQEAEGRPRHRHQPEIETFSIVRQAAIPQQSLGLMLRALSDNLGPNLLRVKGLLNIAEEPERPALLQAAQTMLHDVVWLDRWPSADRRSRLVFITLGAGRQVVDEIMEIVDKMGANAMRRVGTS